MYRLFFPETLHQDHQGLGRRLVNQHLQKQLTVAGFEHVNQQLLRAEAFPGQPLHRKGFLGSSITAHEAYCMLQRLGPAVLTLAVQGSLSESLKQWLRALTSA